MSLTFDLKAKLESMGLAPKKAFGQNFLVNQQVIDKIIFAAREFPFTDLVEVGPGLGALTEPMLKAGMKPRLVEFDPDLAKYWQAQNLDVLHADALKLNWNDLGLKENSLFVSNLPYQISTSIVIERCLGPRQIRRMVLMFQKEVAQRLTAAPSTKEYGFLSVVAQLHFKMRKVSEASPRDFFPAPKVASRVLHFERIEREALGMPFLKFTKRAFALRRKFLLKNLAGTVDKAMLQALGLNEKVRAEELKPAQFEQLFREVESRKKN